MTADKPNWFQVAFQLQGSVIPTVFPRVLMCGGLGVLVSLLHKLELPVSLPILGSIIPNVVFNLVLGLLLVFRTNTAYERFWEGRKSWGTLVVNVRNLARQIQVSVAVLEPMDQENKAAALRLLSAFAIATKLHLRQEPINTELEGLLAPLQVLKLKSVKTPPLEITLWLGDYLQQQQQRHCLSMDQLTAMNSLIDKLVEALTGCERIINTPMPLAYAIHLKQLMLLYCLSLPFQIVNELNWWTGFTVGLISFTLLGLEAIGIEIENPFGQDSNDLPLDEICTTILQNIEDFISPNSSDRSTIEASKTLQV
ncbi:MAG TPA: bestrophin family ion channel [Coleofasciculaceae cyanobacterium]|jgi:putative membrane protein